MVQDLSIIYSSTGANKVVSEIGVLQQQSVQAAAAVTSMGNALADAGGKVKALRGPDGRFLPKGTIPDLNATAGAFGSIAGGAGVAARAVSTLRGEVLQIGGAFAGLAAIKTLGAEMFAIEDATASLEAITGATGATLQYLGEQASKTGRDIQGGATAILGSYEAIASARPELLKNAEALAAMTDDAKLLAQAAGGDLNTNAKALTTTLAQFQLQSDQSRRVVNALAAGSLEGAAGIDELTQSFQVSGVALSNSNVSAEEAIALYEVLADRGLKGAEAGTQMRNIFLKLSQGDLLPKESLALMEGLGVNIDKLKDKTNPLSEDLAELAKITQDAGVAAKIFGTENVSAASIIGNSIPRFEELREKVTGTDVALRQAAIRTSTTSFQLLRLKNAAIELGVKLLSAFKPVIQGAATLIEGLIGVGGAIADNKAAALIALGAFAAYNAVIIQNTAVTLANAIAAKTMAAYRAAEAALMPAIIGLQAAYITVTNALTGSITIATAAQRLLNIALTSNPIGLVIAGVTALGAALYYLTGTTKKLTEVEQACADASAQVAEQFGKESANSEILFIKLKNLNPKSEEARKLRDEINTTYGTYLPNQLTEASNLGEIAKAQDLVTAALLRKIQAQVTEAKITEVVAKKTENLLGFTDEISKATGLTTSRITSAVSEFGKLIGGRSFEEAGQIFEQFGYDASALSGAMVRLGGVSSGTAKAIEEINRAGLGDSFLDMALNAGQADAKISALNDLFKETAPTINGVTDGATEAGNAIAGIAGGTDGRPPAAGSIDALNAQLQRLQDQFNAVGSAAKRADLAQQIALLQDEITVASGGRAFNPIEVEFALGGALVTDADAIAAKNKLFTSLAEAIGASSDLDKVMERGARASDFFAEAMAANMATAETAALSLRETLISKLGEEAFGKLAQGLENIKGSFIDFAATVAQSIGQAIGSGASLADAFKAALRDLAIQVPKLAGMALLNAAATPGIGPAALPLAIAGLALLGLSGIIAGVTAPKGDALSPSSPSLGSIAPPPQQGLGQFGERSALDFSGSTFVLQVDNEQFGGAVQRVIRSDGRKRTR